MEMVNSNGRLGLIIRTHKDEVGVQFPNEENIVYIKRADLELVDFGVYLHVEKTCRKFIKSLPDPSLENLQLRVNDQLIIGRVTSITRNASKILFSMVFDDESEETGIKDMRINEITKLLFFDNSSGFILSAKGIITPQTPDDCLREISFEVALR